MRMIEITREQNRHRLVEVSKSERRMPGLLEAKKDAASCEKRRGSANKK